jgi:hypothetical protein
MDAQIAWNAKHIERLRADLAFLESGNAEFRSLVDGQWIVTNDAMIARDKATIETLERINARLEARKSDADRT